MKTFRFFSINLSISPKISLLALIILILLLPLLIFQISTSQDKRQFADEIALGDACTCQSLSSNEIASDNKTTFVYKTKINEGVNKANVADISVQFYTLRERDNQVEEIAVSPIIPVQRITDNPSMQVFQAEWEYMLPSREVIQKDDIYTVRAEEKCTVKQVNLPQPSKMIALKNQKVLAATSGLQIQTFIPGLKAKVTQLNICNMMQFIFN